MLPSKKWFMAIVGAFCGVLAVSTAQGNLLSDAGFENGIDPLPGLPPVVGPPFSPGFWGAELGGEVPAEFSVTPLAGNYMLYMENEGGIVTQTFQAVNVTSYAGMIDAGLAVASLAAFYNAQGGFAGVTTAPGLLFFAGINDWGSPLGSTFANFTLDASPNTWEPYVLSAPVPPLTRWIVVQLGYVDATLPFGTRAYVDESSLRVIPEPGSLALLAFGAGTLLLRRR